MLMELFTTEQEITGLKYAIMIFSELVMGVVHPMIAVEQIL